MNPTLKLIISTFEEDLLGLKEFANRLDKFIATEQKFVEGSLVIALSAKFGFGKTTFLKMWSSSLKNAEKKEDRPFIISLNAWETDYCGDPLYAIISALVECIQEEAKEEKEEEAAKKLKDAAQKLINAAKNFGWFATAIVGQVVKKRTGINVGAAGRLALEKRANGDDELMVLPDTFSIYEDRKKAMKSLKGAIQEFVEESERKTLFLVDELDRCRPDYAISYLETIKHIFDVRGAVFVLAADRQQLENSAKKAFGPGLKFEEYYRKFIHREVSLPEISEEHYKDLASKYVDYFLEGEGSRICFMKLTNDRREGISKLVSALKLTPRQLQEVFRILGHLLEITEEKQGNLQENFGMGSILMVALKIGESKVYYRLGGQSLEPQEAVEIFKNLLDEFTWDIWFKLILTGGGLKMEKGERAEDILTKYGLADYSENPINPVDLSVWRAGWGFHNSNGLVQIYNKIEQISQWD